MNKFRKSLLVTALIAAGMNSAHAAIPAVSTSNNFSMVNPSGAVTGRNTDVAFGWDGTYNTAVAGAVDNATLSTATTFFGYTWTAHNVKVFAPGSYNIGGYTLNVGAGQVGLHMLFDWGANPNISVVEVCQPGVFSYVPPGVAPQTWSCASVDGNGDGLPGISMNNGPFIGFNANFNLNGITAAVAPTLDVTTPVTPASGSTVSASATTAYVVNFSKAMDANTISSSLLTFFPSVTVLAPTDVGGLHTQFSFPVALKSGTPYTVSFNSTNVKDLTGMPFTAPGGKTLITSPLTVTGTSPANGGTGVSPGASLFSVTFSEPMNPATVLTNYLTLNPGAITPASVSDSGDRRTFNFGVTLAGLTTYTVAFGAGPQDATGGAVAAHASVSYATLAAVDLTTPTVVAGSRSPAPLATGQALQPTLGVIFSKPMDPSFTAPAIHVTKVVGGATVPCPFTADATNTIFSCTVGSNLDYSSDYQISVTGAGAGKPSVVSAAQDSTNHNNLLTNANNTWTFTTRAAVTTMTGSGVTAQTDTGEVTAIGSSPTPPAGTPLSGVTYDADYVTYVVGNIPGGTNTVNVTLTFQNSIAGKELYKINGAGVYTKIQESATLGALGCVFQRVAGAGNENKAIVTIMDNGSCDLDSTPGVISDPIVPATPVVAAAAGAATIGASGGGGGCTVDPKGGTDASLLAALLASLGYLGWRRRRS